MIPFQQNESFWIIMTNFNVLSVEKWLTYKSKNGFLVPPGIDNNGRCDVMHLVPIQRVLKEWVRKMHLNSGTAL